MSIFIRAVRGNCDTLDETLNGIARANGKIHALLKGKGGSGA